MSDLLAVAALVLPAAAAEAGVVTPESSTPGPSAASTGADHADGRRRGGRAAQLRESVEDIGAQLEVVGFLSDLKRGEEVGFRSVGIAQLLQGVACVDPDPGLLGPASQVGLDLSSRRPVISRLGQRTTQISGVGRLVVWIDSDEGVGSFGRLCGESGTA